MGIDLPYVMKGLKRRRSGKQAHEEITVVAPVAKDTHETQTRQKNIGST